METGKDTDKTEEDMHKGLNTYPELTRKLLINRGITSAEAESGS